MTLCGPLQHETPTMGLCPSICPVPLLSTSSSDPLPLTHRSAACNVCSVVLLYTGPQRKLGTRQRCSDPEQAERPLMYADLSREQAETSPTAAWAEPGSPWGEGQGQAAARAALLHPLQPSTAAPPGAHSSAERRPSTHPCAGRPWWLLSPRQSWWGCCRQAA